MQAMDALIALPKLLREQNEVLTRIAKVMETREYGVTREGIRAAMDVLETHEDKA